MEELFDTTGEVKTALATNRPVVALESTIITHGMPWPDNLATAQAVEETVRKNGATPATIAVLNGRVRIGLETSEIEQLAQAKDVMKLSRADFAYAISAGKTGSTTVAATMMAAQRSGIEVFATGGIGGVHRGAEETFDISADLQELSQTNMIVVSAGPKAILDIEKTLEVLETNGVPVVAYGCNEIPAFWSRNSDLPAPLRMDTPAEIANFWNVRTKLRQNGGLLITNPVPPGDEIPAAVMNGFIHAGIEASQAAGVTGKNVTPWLLDFIMKETDGKSLETNIALIKNNAGLAAEIAVSLK